VQGTGALDILFEECTFEANGAGDYAVQVADGDKAPSGPVAFWNVRARDAAGRVRKISFTREF